jgi:hypothetical protein
MNNRIKDLAGQAKVMAEGTINRKISKNAELDAFAEKLAELIVRECIDICYNHPGRMPSNNWQGVTVPLDIVHRLEEHFGVEE